MNTQHEITKRAVIYCRVSTKEQVDEGNSLHTQEKICREYALANGYDIAEVFIEQGESAKTTDRKELQRLIHYCSSSKNKVTAVIAYKIDRISRNTDDYSQIRILLKSYKVEIKSTTEFFDNNPAGRFMENIIANVAQFDNDVRTERSVGGMRDATREGRYVWTAPVGYSNVKIGGKATIAPNSMAPFVTMAYELTAQNIYPTQEVRRKVTEAGLRTNRGKILSVSHFRKMLSCITYYGSITKFGETHQGTFETIISKETYDQVQRVLTHRTRKNYYYVLENPDFPLRRFVHHPNGLNLTGSWSQGRNKKYPYYRFQMKGGDIKKDVMENKFKEYVDLMPLNEKYHDKFVAMLKGHVVKGIEERQQKAERLKRHLSELTEKQNALVQKNLEGVLSNDVLKQQLKLIEDEMQNAYSELARTPDRKVNQERLLQFIIDFLEKPSKIWALASFQAQLQFQWFHFPKGMTFDGQNFRTTETCKYIKAKKDFFALNDYRVHSGIRPTNHNKVNTDISIENLDEISDELIGFAEIMTSLSGKD